MSDNDNFNNYISDEDTPYSQRRRRAREPSCDNLFPESIPLTNFVVRPDDDNQEFHMTDNDDLNNAGFDNETPYSCHRRQHRRRHRRVREPSCDNIFIDMPTDQFGCFCLEITPSASLCSNRVCLQPQNRQINNSPCGYYFQPDTSLQPFARTSNSPLGYYARLFID